MSSKLCLLVRRNLLGSMFTCLFLVLPQIKSVAALNRKIRPPASPTKLRCQIISVGNYTCRSLVQNDSIPNRTLLVPVPKVAHSSLCPWSAVTRAFKLAGVYQSTENASAPSFTYREGSALKALTYASFTNKLKLALDKCGFDSARFSGHSFRRGELLLLCIAVCLVTI